MVHELKCWPEYYAAVQSGQKTFEVRKWDRPYREGDSLLLKEYDPKTMSYTGQETLRTISYILDLTYLPGDNIPHFANYAAIGIVLPDMASLTAQLTAVQAERDAAVDAFSRLDYQLEKHQTCAAVGNRQYAHGIRDARKIIAQMLPVCAENAPEGGNGDG